MSDELAARLVEEGRPELAHQLEQKRLAAELREANRPDLADALEEPQPEPDPEQEPEPDPSEAELVARELGRLNHGWMRLKA